MDKVKEIVAQIQKYHFWILCGLVVVVGFISWYMATSSLDAQTAANANAIKGKDGEIQGVKNTPDHPNDNFAKGMENIILPFSAQIGIGWDKRYEHQKSLLVWPAALTKEAEGFIEQVDNLRPIEKIPFPTPREQEIEIKYLQAYRYFITRELPRLAEIIGAKWYVQVAESNSASGGGGTNIFKQPLSGGGGEGPGAGGTTTAEVDKSIVFWDEENQKQILDLHFGFASKSSQQPTTLEVLYAQEDLWVLEAIMQIIKKTNGGADANYNAPIKEIKSIQIGQTARGRMGKIIPVQQRRADAHPGGPGAGGSPMTIAPPPGAAGNLLQATDAEKADPAYERYVDIDYNPLPVSTLRNAATSVDPKIAIYAVAKRVPVRLRFIMDQRNLSDLLAQCGNFNLPVEVRQVRINCQEGLQSDDAILSGGRGMESGGVGRAGPNRPAGAGGSTAIRPKKKKQNTGGGVPGDTEAKEDPNEIEAEIFGIVYIFNPVNEKQLGIELRRNQEAGTDKPAGATPPTAALPTGSNPRS